MPHDGATTFAGRSLGPFTEKARGCRWTAPISLPTQPSTSTAHPIAPVTPVTVRGRFARRATDLATAM